MDVDASPSMFAVTAAFRMGKRWMAPNDVYYRDPQLMREGQRLRIGDTGQSEFMDGIIDEVRVWNDALTDDQVKRLN